MQDQFIKVYRNVLPKELCKQMIDTYEKLWTEQEEQINQHAEEQRLKQEEEQKQQEQEEQKIKQQETLRWMMPRPDATLRAQSLQVERMIFLYLWQQKMQEVTGGVRFLDCLKYSVFQV